MATTNKGITYRIACACGYDGRAYSNREGALVSFDIHKEFCPMADTAAIVSNEQASA